MDLTTKNIHELAQMSFECTCGKKHEMNIEQVIIEPDCMDKACQFAKGKVKENEKILILCDKNTYPIAAKPFYEKLKKTHQNTQCHIIESRNGQDISPDDQYIGQVFIEIPNDIDFFIAVGSGVINDITRQISYKLNKPYMIFGTAPSMDGYASITSSLIVNHVKVSIQGHYPCAIYGDTNILINAPFEMITAGFGDVIGKYNAIREWDFARKYLGEHYCENIVALVEQAVKTCEEQADAIKRKEPKAIENVMNALILSGMAMGLYQNTRPASGAEHHIVHYWDVDCIKRGVAHPLHGNAVGVGTLIICKLYELIKDQLPVSVMDLDAKKIKETLEKAGCQTSPKELGISDELLRESIKKGHTMSAKYTILTYLSKENPQLLDWVADRIVENFQ